MERERRLAKGTEWGREKALAARKQACQGGGAIHRRAAVACGAAGLARRGPGTGPTPVRGTVARPDKSRVSGVGVRPRESRATAARMSFLIVPHCREGRGVKE